VIVITSSETFEAIAPSWYHGDEICLFAGRPMFVWQVLCKKGHVPCNTQLLFSIVGTGLSLLVFPVICWGTSCHCQQQKQHKQTHCTCFSVALQIRQDKSLKHCRLLCHCRYKCNSLVTLQIQMWGQHIIQLLTHWRLRGRNLGRLKRRRCVCVCLCIYVASIRARACTCA